jgi:hypothetical protein
MIAILVIAVFIVGFFGGQYYSNHQNPQIHITTTSPDGNSKVCNCPNIPINATPADISKICPC